MFALPPSASICGAQSHPQHQTNHPGTFHSQLSRFQVLTVLTALFSFLQISQAQTVSNNYFGMHMHGGVISHQPWPVVSFGTVSLWDASVSWGDINTSNGVYDFSNLDKWMTDAKAHNDQVVYTFGRVPQWASSIPYESGCATGPGTCAPPNDVNADGTGSDQHFKSFVTALAAHNKASTTAHITYWELWNEPYNAPSWVGSIPQIVRMVGDATAILKAADPNAVVLVPSVCIEGTKALKWLDAYLAAGGNKYADMVAFHGYVQKRGMPLHAENVLGYITAMRAVLAKYGLQGKAIWDTEYSWGRPDVSSPTFYDEDMRAGFVGQSYLLQQSAGVGRLLWYQWNNPEFGTMWTPNPNVPSAPGTVLKPGVAFGQVQNWIVGASPSSQCSANGTVWTCSYTRSGGYSGLAVWDTAQSCANGSCTTSSFKIGSQYVQYRTLDGTTVKVTGSSVPVGYKPILIEN